MGVCALDAFTWMRMQDEVNGVTGAGRVTIVGLRGRRRKQLEEVGRKRVFQTLAEGRHAGHITCIPAHTARFCPCQGLATTKCCQR